MGRRGGDDGVSHIYQFATQNVATLKLGEELQFYTGTFSSVQHLYALVRHPGAEHNRSDEPYFFGGVHQKTIYV